MGVEGYRNLKSWFSTTFGSSLKFVSQCLSHRQYAKLRRFQNPERKGLFTVPFCPRLTFRVFDKAEKEKYKKAWRYEWKEIAAASIQVVCYEDGELFRFRAKKKLNSYTDKWYGEIIGRKDFGELPIETALCTFQESIYGFGASTDLMKKVERQLQCEPIVKPHARIPLFCWTITLNRADLDIAALKEHQATVITEDRKEFWFGKTKKYYEKFNDFEWLPFSSHLERHLNDPASRFEWKEWKSSRKAWYLDVHERMLFCLISLFDAGLGQVAKFNCFNLEEMKGGTELNLKDKMVDMEGLITICEWLPKNPQSHHVDLTYNFIGDEETVFLAKFRQDNAMDFSVDLRENYLSRECVEQLISNYNLTEWAKID